MITAAVACLTGPAAVVLADHYGFTATYYNTYIIGWNTYYYVFSTINTSNGNFAIQTY